MRSLNVAFGTEMAQPQRLDGFVTEPPPPKWDGWYSTYWINRIVKAKGIISGNA